MSPKQSIAALSVGIMLALGCEVAFAQQVGLPGSGAAPAQPPPAVQWTMRDGQVPPAGFPVGLPQVPQELPAPAASTAAATPAVDQAESPGAPAAAPQADGDLGMPEDSPTGDGDEADSSPYRNPKEEPEESDLAKRVADLEKALKKQSEQETKKSEEAAKKPAFKIGGRVQVDDWAFPDTTPGINRFENPATGVDPEDRLAFRRIRLETQGDIFETMLYRMQVDFADPATPAIKDVYIGFEELPYNQTLTIGNQKRPLGLDSLDSSRFTVFMERPLVIDTFAEDYRRLGMLVSGYTDDLAYNWQYGVFNLENIANTGAYVGDSLQLSGNARLAGTPWYDETSGGRGYFHWGVAGMVANPDGDVSPLDSNTNTARFRSRPELRSTNRWIDTGAIRGADWYEIVGLESRLNIGSLLITSEYETNWLQRDNTTVGTGPDVNFHGAYIGLSYFLTGEHHPINRTVGTLERVHPFENFFLVDRCKGGRGYGWGAWEVVFRYSYLDLTDRDIRGGVEHNLTYGFNWHWTSHSKLMFNAVSGNIEDRAPVAGFTSGNFTGLGTRLQVDF